MVVVTDASPVIFLGKIDSQNLIPDLLGDEILIPRAMYDEILITGLPPDEERVRTEFLSRCTIE